MRSGNLKQAGRLENLLSCPRCNNRLVKKSVSPEYTRNLSELWVAAKDDTVIKTGNWEIHYNPQTISKTQIMSKNGGDRVTYSFHGTSVIAYFLKCDWCGVAEIRLDGAFVKTIDMYSPIYEFGFPCIVEASSDGPHTIDVVVTPQKNVLSKDNQIWIDGFGGFSTTYDAIYYCENCHKQFPIVKGVVDFTDSDDKLVGLYNSFFLSSGDDHYGFNQLPGIAKVGHFLRMDVLDGLLDEDMVKGKTAVDIGCGSWGFACIYPKLQNCSTGIGVDISLLAAIRSNEKGDDFFYVASSENLPFKDSSIDIVFAGEVIEHVVNPADFIKDVQRVLKDDGILILTTPNPHPLLYRVKGLVYGEGPEHISLLPYHKLISLLSDKFTIVSSHGINLSFNPSLDRKVNNSTVLKLWSRLFLHMPYYATGVIVKCRKI